MSFKDYDEVTTPLILPIRGKKYVIRELDIDEGIRILEDLSPTSETKVTNEEFFRRLLGDTLDEMRADKVPVRAIPLAAHTALVDLQSNRAAAEVYWETGGDPKAAETRLDAARAALRPAETTPPAAASTTKPRASGSGTRTSRKN